MRTRPIRLDDRKIKIITLGCAKNVVDSEAIGAQLSDNQYQVGHGDGATDAAIVIVNTCGFIDQAKTHSRETIDKYMQQKRMGRIRKLFVTGCLSQRYGDEMRAELPEVDGIFGVKDMPALLAELNAEYRDELVGERLSSRPPYSSYLKISEGCNRACSFCVIPAIRGKHISRPMDELVAEATGLVARGAREIMLIAQDLTFYGLDTSGKRDLNELLLRLTDIPGLEWLRLHYAHPASFPTEILTTMRERTNICRYLDIPLQHISSNMLKTMRRSIDGPGTIELVKQIRSEVPGIHLRSTFLVGHPGETEEDFEQLREFLATTRLERVGVFMYSNEEDTHSFALGDDVPAEIKQERFDILMQQQQQISLELNQAKVGSTLPVLVEGMTRSRYFGRTEFDSPEVDNEVLFTGNQIQVGTFCNVEITDAREYDLVGVSRND